MTRSRELYAALVAAQQQNANLLLQGFNLLTDGRLRHVQFLGRPGEILPLRNSHEIFKMAQFQVADSNRLYL